MRALAVWMGKPKVWDMIVVQIRHVWTRDA